MERHIEAERIDLVINLFGNFDENVKIIEKELDVAIINRGSDIKIGGEPEGVDRAASAVNALLAMAARGETISESEVRYVMSQIEDGNEEKLEDLGKDVICIYVAIGQKQSTVANVVDTLSKHGAMDYSIVVSATASEMAPLQYIAPYAGVAMAEYFMLQGKDVLCVYDDLSKHAVAYRTMSLLLQRPTGREAYPGDVFYLHSRLLERACCLNKDYGGGSITALPIIETQAGDVSAYIPTNVISITDGQIFLESELFFSGVRPAVNPGISVSRVGGSAQIKAMKKVSGSLKLLYSQYRELQSFSQFGSDLDKDTKERLAQGERIVEVLKQGKTSPLDVEKQVVIIYAVVNNYLKNIRVEDIAEFEKDLFVYIDETHPDIFSSIRETGELTKENEQAIKDVLAEYSQKFLQSR